MTLFGFALLADENINPLVVASLRLLGCDITTVAELGLAGSPDQAILERAAADHRIVVTHDQDFGRLAIQGRSITTGVVFLRPGHISPDTVVAALKAADAPAVELELPFILTIEHKASGIRIRVRQLPTHDQSRNPHER